MTSRRIRETDLADIQGNIVRGYRLPHAAHLFATISATSAQDWRRALLQLAVTSEACSTKPRVARNVGISHAGMTLLVPHVAGEFDAFEAYASGMQARARLLGDGADARWSEWDARHVWISVHAATPQQLQVEVQRLQAELPPLHPRVLFAEAITDDQGNWLEPFGFRDDISQPAVSGAPNEDKLVNGNGKLDAERKGWLPIAAGEFVLGHLDERDRDRTAKLPTIRPLLVNGTFAVFRELVQDVESFHDTVAAAARAWQVAPEVLKAKLVGRHPDGTPLVKAEGPSNFTYDEDQHGRRCPLGAHVRRVNPRLDGEHRIIRRGMPFRRKVEGHHTVAAEEQGMYLVALNASIEDQFEFMQARWINGAVGALPGSRDPLVGEGPRHLALCTDGAAGDPLLMRLTTFVTCRGGQYYLMPSLSALRQIASAAERSSARGAPRGSLVRDTVEQP